MLQGLMSIGGVLIGAWVVCLAATLFETLAGQNITASQTETTKRAQPA